ncbi:hypothetical protein S96127_3985 [Yersinia pestis]|nr:hypothetical protein S96127_3985 [Yersinia pestis]
MGSQEGMYLAAQAVRVLDVFDTETVSIR